LEEAVLLEETSVALQVLLTYWLLSAVVAEVKAIFQQEQLVAQVVAVVIAEMVALVIQHKEIMVEMVVLRQAVVVAAQVQ
jgi:hypothetical protein